MCASALPAVLIVVCASVLLVVCASALLVVLQFIARCVSFRSVVVCASALQVMCGFEFLQCSCL